MTRKRIFATIGILFLMFASEFGTLIEMAYRNGQSGEGVFVMSILSVVIVSAVVMFFPFICRLKHKEKLPYEKGCQICLWNSVVILIVSVIMIIITGFGIIGGLGAFAYYFINKWFFVNDELMDISYNVQDGNNSDNMIVERESVSYENETNGSKQHECISNYNLKINEKIETEEAKIDEKRNLDITKEEQKNNRTSFVVIALALCISLVFNIVLLGKVSKLENKIEKVEYNLSEMKDKNDFIDENIVFIADDNTNLYHKYECDKFQDCEEYWAHNVEFAKYEGYKPCSKCYK